MTEDPFEPYELLDQAVAYHYSAQLVGMRASSLSFISKKTIERSWIHDMGFVSGVLAAFSAELYLKAWYILLNSNPPKTHNLLKLFNSLPQDTQREIERLNKAPMTYREILESGQNNFVEIRYMRLDLEKSLMSWSTALTEPLHAYTMAQAKAYPERFKFSDLFSQEDLDNLPHLPK